MPALTTRSLSSSVHGSSLAHCCWSPLSRRAGLCVLLLCVLCAAASTARAQNIQFTQGEVGSGLDNTLQIPLRTYQGRGGADLPVTLYYSSRV